MRAGQYLEYLTATPAEYGNPLEDAHARDYAVRDFKAHLKTVRRSRPSSVNLSLAAVDNFYRFLEMGKPEVRREELPGAAPRANTPKFARIVPPVLPSRWQPTCSSARAQASGSLVWSGWGWRVDQKVSSP